MNRQRRLKSAWRVEKSGNRTVILGGRRVSSGFWRSFEDYWDRTGEVMNCMCVYVYVYVYSHPMLDWGWVSADWVQNALVGSCVGVSIVDRDYSSKAGNPSIVELSSGAGLCETCLHEDFLVSDPPECWRGHNALPSHFCQLSGTSAIPKPGEQQGRPIHQWIRHALLRTVPGSSTKAPWILHITPSIPFSHIFVHSLISESKISTL